MRRLASGLLVAFALASIGCASDNRTYYWSSYQWSAYSGNQISRGGPDSQRFESTLKRIIEKSAASKRKVPPGVLAEYGYLFFERDEMDTAIEYFQREAREWPESEVFMNRMIEQAQEGAPS